MSDLPYPPAVPVAPETPGLTQMQRVLYTYSAPSKTFADIKRSTSWWLPFIISMVFSYALFGVIQYKVTWPQVAENIVKATPKQAEQLDKLKPADRAAQIAGIAKFTQILMAASPIVAIVFILVLSLLFWVTINFGFGGTSTFSEVFAVSWYASLTGLVKVVLGIISLFAGVDPESFNIQNFAGSNIGYYLPQDAPKALLAFATSLDAITIWGLVLTAIGISIVAKKKRSAGYITVFGWWALGVLVHAGWVAATS
jgi:Yip1-like protein